MMWMVRVIVLLAGALTIGLIVSFAWGRLRPPTDAQAQAITLLNAVPAPDGAFNAWATFWLLDYDVPAAQVDPVYAQEREHLRAWARRVRLEKSPTVSYLSRVEENFPKRPALSGAKRRELCFPTDPDCLGKVRANLHALRQLLASQTGPLAQLRAIPPDAVLWDDTPNTAHTPLPSLGVVGNLRLTAAALDFADGRQVPALAQVCRDARTVRHLRAHTNSLFGAMVANSWMYPIERLLAGMLTELPPDQPLPEDCGVAFAPVTYADIDMCAPVQREHQGLQDVFANVVPDETHRVRRLQVQMLIDIEHSRWLTAPTYAWVCQPAVIRSVLADRPVSSRQMQDVRYDFFDALSNPTGLTLARIPPPDFADYLNRNGDYAASLRAMAWLLANRRNATISEDWRQRLATALPDLQQQGSRHFQTDAEGHQLVMTYRNPRQKRAGLVLRLTK